MLGPQSLAFGSRPVQAVMQAGSMTLLTACMGIGYRHEIAWTDRAELPAGFRQEW